MSRRTADVTDINPLADYAATFDLFYQFVRGQVGNLVSNQYIQIKAAAEPFDASTAYPWFTYYTYLLRTDATLQASPLADQFLSTDRPFSEEYERFVNTALQFVERHELDAKTVERINELGVLRQNIRDRLKALVKEDANDWRDYCDTRGALYGDQAAYAQWSATMGNGTEVSQKQKELLSVEGDLARERAKAYPNPDEKEIKDTYDGLVSAGSRLRYPRRPDTEYPNGKQFNLAYLANLPPGSSALFDDRFFVFPQTSLDTILTSGIGSFSEKITKSTRATQSMTSDWGASGSTGWWFGVRASAGAHTTIQTDFQQTQEVQIGCKSLMAIPLTAPWFRPGLFDNAIVAKQAASFQRFFGPAGTLLYYPRALIVMRGFRVAFSSSAAFKYDYARDFAARGSAGLRVFGIGFGGSYSESSHTEEHRITQSGNQLSFEDGDNTVRVVGFVAQKNKTLNESIMSPLLTAYGETMAQFSAQKNAR
jgi:hypothetical protein